MAGRIILENVTRVFTSGKARIKAVDGIDLHVPSGGFLVVAGSSGSGKSTLLNLIGAMERPTSGNIKVGKDFLHTMNETSSAMFRRQRIGFIFQNNNLISSLTVYENLELPLLLSGVNAKKQKIMELLEEIDMADKKDMMPHQLSGGQQQRVAVGRAMVHHPAVVLADEPTAHLDSANARRILLLLQNLHDKYRTTLLFATHDPAIIDRCESVIQLEDGRVIP